MEYKVEELSPVKRKVAVEVSVEEVQAALAATVALYRKGAEIKGFRKGKVPSSVVEAKYRKQIYGEATTDLINYHINEILGELKLSPLSRIDVDAKEMEREEDFSYSFSFEIAPSFDLPEYKGLAVEEEDVVVDPQQVEDVIERIRQNMAKTVIIKDERPAATGDIAVIDFQAFQDGLAMEGIAANKFELPLGEGNSLPEFEDIVIGMTPGGSKESELTFPADFINDKLAGQTVSMQVTLHAIKVRDLPEVNDDFAELAGGYTSVQDLKDAIEKSYVSTRKQLVKGDAQKKLLDGIKAEVSFELPQSIVEEQIDKQIVELQGKLERQGKSLDSLGAVQVIPGAPGHRQRRKSDGRSPGSGYGPAEDGRVHRPGLPFHQGLLRAAQPDDSAQGSGSGRQGHGTYIRKRHGDHGSPGSSPERIVSRGAGLDPAPFLFREVRVQSGRQCAGQGG